jgi:hypothetical protein
LNDWPNPPLLNYLLLENPWPLFAVLVVAGLMGVVYAVRRKMYRLALGCTAVIAVGIALVPLASMVQTDREQLIMRTAALANAVVPKFDAGRLGELLAPIVTFSVKDMTPMSSSKQELLALAERAHRRYTFEKSAVTALDARQLSDTTGKSDLSVRVEVAAKPDSSMAIFGSGPVATRWMLDWQQNAQGKWMLSGVRWLQVNGREPAESMVP